MVKTNYPGRRFQSKKRLPVVGLIAVVGIIVLAAFVYLISNSTKVTLTASSYAATQPLQAVVKTHTPQTVTATLVDGKGANVTVKVVKAVQQGGVSLSITPPVHFRPGKYTLKVAGADGRTLTQDFSWGVLAINTDQSVYTPGDTAQLSLAVLNEKGMMACDASVDLEITDPNGTRHSLSTANKEIEVTPECNIKEYLTKPDMSASYRVGTAGTYRMNLSATTQNGTYQISDSFTVKDSVPFVVMRQSQTRIYPIYSYPVSITIRANQDFQGEVIERVPKAYTISQPTNGDLAYSLVRDGESEALLNYQYKEVAWQLSLSKGESKTIGYIYTPLKQSPDFYTLGPLRFMNEEGSEVFSETRVWQIAVDAASNILFMETPDALNGANGNTNTQFWTTPTGTVTYDTTTTPMSGNGSWKMDATSAQASLAKGAVLNPAGRRISFYARFSTLSATNWLEVLYSNSSDYFNLKFSGSNIQLNTSGGNTKTGTTTLSTNTWYRITLDFVITSSTSYTINVFVNGTQDLNVTNTDFSLTGATSADTLQLGYVGASGVMNLENVYIDDGTTLDDPGDIRVTAKLPNSLSTNTFGTVIGSTPASRWLNVDERPLNTTNGWATSSTAQTEDYGVESAATGDVDLTGATIVGYGGWVYTNRGSGTAPVTNLMTNGSASSITTTTTNTVFSNYVLSSTYPTGAFGLQKTSGSPTVNLYETGALIAYIPPPPTPTPTPTPFTEVKIKGGSVIHGGTKIQ